MADSERPSALKNTLDEEEVRRLAGPLRLSWMNLVAASPIIPNRIRHRLLRVGGVSCGRCGIWHHVRFVGGCDVSIGDFSFVSSGVVFDARAHIEVGTRVAIGPNAMLLTSTHEIGPSDHRAGGGYAKFAPIVVEDGCWIGAGAIILPGVTVGRGCIVGAGAVVTKDCEPDGLYTGVPATRKRNLPIATAAVDLGSERTLGRLLAAEGGFAATFERPFEG